MIITKRDLQLRIDDGERVFETSKSENAPFTSFGNPIPRNAWFEIGVVAKDGSRNYYECDEETYEMAADLVGLPWRNTNPTPTGAD